MKNICKKYLFEAIVLVILIVGFFLVNRSIDKRQAILNENAYEYNFYNDSVTVVDGKLKFVGWCYRIGMDTPELGSESANNFKVILFDEAADIDTVEDLEKASVIVDTVRKERADVYEIYGAEDNYQYDYTYSGYEAIVDAANLDMTGKDYVLAFRYGDNSNHLVRTEIHLNDIIK